jgi:CHAT domain-containing protein/tetratricopeptide (TPR) repeat protein
MMVWFAADVVAQLPPDPAPATAAAQQLLQQAKAAHKEVPASSLRRAISLLDHAQTMFAKAGNARGQIEALLEQADIFRDLSRFREASAAYDRAERLARSDPVMMAAVLNGRARLYLDQEDSEKAEAAAEEALKLSRAGGDRRGEAAALVHRGEARYLRTDDVAAARDLADASAIAEAERDQRTLAFAIRDIGLVDEDQGRLRRVIELMQRSGDLFRSLGDLRSEILTTLNVASMQSLMGDRETVLASHQNVLTLTKTMGYALGQGMALAAIGVDYAQLNNHRTAIEYYRAALDVFRPIAYIPGQYDIGEVSCRSELAIGKVQAALRDCSQAMALSTQLHDPKREAIAMKTMADTQLRIGRRERALELYTRAAEMSHRVNDPRFEATARLAIGSLRERMNDHAGAIAEFRTALALSISDEVPDSAIAAHHEIARVQRAQGELANARSELEDALKLAEEQRSKVGSGALRSSYFTSLRQSYELYAQVLMDLHQRQPDAGFDRMALEQSEKAHARTLLDSLVERAAEAGEPRDPQAAQRVRDLRARIAAASNERMRLLAFGGSRKQLDANIERIRLLNSEYDALRSASHETAAATTSEHVSALSADQIRQEVLDPDTTLVEYLLGDEAGLAWAVTPRGILSFALPPRRTLENDVQRWHALMLARKPHPDESAEAYGPRVRRADRELQAVAAKLACTLVGPVISQLNTRRLAIVPDGGLEYIAFGALPLDGCGHSPAQPLVSRFEVVAVPSASSVRALRRELQTRPAPTSGIAVLADPVFTPDDPRVGGTHPVPARSRVAGALGAAMRDLGWNSGIPRLPGTRLEARTIAAHANGVRVALDFDASLATALRPEMSRYRILHFATHGLLDAEQPEFSGLILSLVDRKGKNENGYLSAQDIYEQRLLADLVVLSACDSGLGATLRGEGVVGLARAFLHAGAARVVSSLWKVDDEATSELMRHFYDGMLRDQKPPAAALHYAQMQMMRQQRWSAPFYWAGFVLNGEWR